VAVKVQCGDYIKSGLIVMVAAKPLVGGEVLCVVGPVLG
jgi:hypothetical protein